MEPITADQLDELTREPLLAVLSTVNPDGTPQATPLWYHYDGERSSACTALFGEIEMPN